MICAHCGDQIAHFGGGWFHVLEDGAAVSKQCKPLYATPMPEKKYVKGEYLGTQVEPGEKWCLKGGCPEGSYFCCSLKKGHAGPHVAAVGHKNEIVSVWGEPEPVWEAM